MDLIIFSIAAMLHMLVSFAYDFIVHSDIGLFCISFGGGDNCEELECEEGAALPTTEELVVFANVGMWFFESVCKFDCFLSQKFYCQNTLI